MNCCAKSVLSRARPDECVQKIQEYRAAGCTHIMLEIWGDDRTGQAKLFGDEVSAALQIRSEVRGQIAEVKIRTARFFHLCNLTSNL